MSFSLSNSALAAARFPAASGQKTLHLARWPARAIESAANGPLARRPSRGRFPLRSFLPRGPWPRLRRPICSARPVHRLSMLSNVARLLAGFVGMAEFRFGSAQQPGPLDLVFRQCPAAANKRRIATSPPDRSSARIERAYRRAGCGPNCELLPWRSGRLYFGCRGRSSMFFDNSMAS